MNVDATGLAVVTGLAVATGRVAGHVGATVMRRHAYMPSPWFTTQAVTVRYSITAVAVVVIIFITSYGLW